MKQAMLPAMRRLLPLVALAWVAGCGSPSKAKEVDLDALAPGPPQPDVASVRHDLHCTERASGEETACKAKPGCALQPPLHCYGMKPPEEQERKEQEAYAASSEPCQCICEEERTACAHVP